MKIIYTQDPLANKVEVDSHDIHFIKEKYKEEKYSYILVSLEMEIDRQKKLGIFEVEKIHELIKKWKTVRSDVETNLPDLIDEVKNGIHMGDCIALPCTCFKCYGEYLLDINTAQGNPVVLSHIANAYAKGAKTIDEAIEKLKQPDTRENIDSWYGKYSDQQLARLFEAWAYQKKLAIEFLIKYKKKHNL